MFSHLTIQNLCCIALSLDGENKIRRRRFGVHKILKARKDLVNIEHHLDI